LVSPVLVARTTFSIYYCKYCKYSVLLFPIMYTFSYVKFVMFVYILDLLLCRCTAQYGPSEGGAEHTYVNYDHDICMFCKLF
jgi:hypothetical protein